MPLKIIRNDITKMQVDAVVNTANEAPTYGDGVDSAVYKAAGMDELLAERKKIGYKEEGEVFITPAFRLPASYIIHAVSPFYEDGNSGEEEKLRECYRKSLRIAVENRCSSIAFPLISTGSFGYPKEEGMRIAVDEMNAFLMNHEMLIYLVVFDEKSTRLGRNIYPDLEAYIDQNYVQDKNEEEYGDSYLGIHEFARCSSRMFASAPVDITPPEEALYEEEDVKESIEIPPLCAPVCSSISIDDISSFLEDNESALNERMNHLSDTFQQYLFYLIELKGMTNPEVYKRAIMDKKLFSKIKNNVDYHPDKATAMRLCVATKLNLDETKDLLARAGYALSPCDKRDIIFSFFIEHEVFDMIEIDIALEEHGLPCFIE